MRRTNHRMTVLISNCQVDRTLDVDDAISPTEPWPGRATNSERLVIKDSCDAVHQLGPQGHADTLESTLDDGAGRRISDGQAALATGNTPTRKPPSSKEPTAHVVGTEVELRLRSRRIRTSCPSRLDDETFHIEHQQKNALSRPCFRMTELARNNPGTARERPTSAM